MLSSTLLCCIFLSYIFLLSGNRRYGKNISPKDHKQPVTNSYRYQESTNIDIDSTTEEIDSDYYESTRKKKYVKSDITSSYTKTFKSKTFVALTSAIGNALLVHILSMLLISKSSKPIVSVLAGLSFIFSYVKGDIGEFCRAVGIFMILVLKRTTVSSFMVKSISQLKSALMLVERRPFPPTTNPWKYNPDDGENQIQFSMMSCVISMILWGAFIGWLVAKPIPLLPGWIGALVGSSFIGYATTLQNSRGDFLRFIGYCLNQIFSVISIAANDVMLIQKSSVILGKLLFLLKGIDSKYHIMDRLQLILSELISRITGAINSVKNNMNDEIPVRNKPPIRKNNMSGYDNSYSYGEDTDR